MKSICLILLTFAVSFCSYSQSDEVDHYDRGFDKYNLKDYNGAILDFNKAIELNSNFINAYLYRGISKDVLGDYNGAIQDYSKVIEVSKDIDWFPDSFILAYIVRGNARYKIGDNKGACLDWSKAGELGEVEAFDLINKYCN